MCQPCNWFMDSNIVVQYTHLTFTTKAQLVLTNELKAKLFRGESKLWHGIFLAWERQSCWKKIFGNTSGNWRVWRTGGILIFGRQSLLCIRTSWTERGAGGGTRATAARGPAVEDLRPRRAALTPAQELVGHGGTDGVQAAAVVERAGGARIAASHPRLLERVAGRWHPPRVARNSYRGETDVMPKLPLLWRGGGGGTGR